ncbi:phosphoenolpyruvate carboxylase [Bdellovibrio bacteriovorus]|nr:phosphoenolpyruvate carboxylase [Bdellovibrio bacteriovorus]
MQKQLAKELTSLVNWAVTELGHVIEAELGTRAFQRIENIRLHVKSKATRDINGLLKLKTDMENLSNQERFEIAHSFALMLELINACESAYRTHRLREESSLVVSEEKHSYGRVIHVLTAHPTESRNSDMLVYLRMIHELLLQRLQSSHSTQTARLHSLIRMAWHLPMSKQRKPTVMDEAEYIYSLVLQDNVIDIYLQQRQEKNPFYIRTWVGGDKDGHPGVDEKTMLGSLNMSRQRLHQWVARQFSEYMTELAPLVRSGLDQRKPTQKLQQHARAVKANLIKIRRISAGDAARVDRLTKSLQNLSHEQGRIFGTESEKLNRIRFLLKIFPGLVVPLELREDSTLVHEALANPSKRPNITRMLMALSRLCPDHNPRDYVRGFVLSQCESAKDITAGVRLSSLHLKGPRLPVVPLFESSHSLKSSKQIISEFLGTQKHVQLIKKHWSGQLEVMLGYSDSAKENGSFPSRYMIQSAIGTLEKAIEGRGLTPIFFHGSGGSIERGGGSIQEQTEWWPLSALKTVKMTVQGEMIYRNYNSPDILQRQLNLLVENRDVRKQKPASRGSVATEKALSTLAGAIQSSYQNILKQEDFLELIEKATPYSFMKDLRMGSRPSKRQGPVQLKSLRAIPWVLCWTQTRALFPTWWGLGSFWTGLSAADKNKYRRAFKESSMFRTYIKAVGFTLEKIELDVFFMYLRSSKLSQSTVVKYEKSFRMEYAKAVKCIREITGEKSLLWYRPWLETSIGLRSPLIHPLNVLQLVALETKDIKLLRETVTGVASGMLTTG